MDRSRPWRDYSFVVLDTETTGLDPATDRVVELAAVRFGPGHEVERVVSSLINPGCPIPKAASDIHGITDEMVQNAPGFAEVWPKALGLFDDNTVAAAYNAPFDRDFLRAENARVTEAAGRPPEGGPMDPMPMGIRAPWLDPLVWVRESDRYAKGTGRHKLGVTCERWGVKLEDGHKAEDDAIAAGRLLLSTRMRNVVASLVSGRSIDYVKSVGVGDPSLGDVMRCQAKLAEEQEARHREFREKMDRDLRKPAQCKSCGAAIAWVKMTGTDRPMPLDVMPVSDGTIVLDETGLRGTVATGDDLVALRAAKATLRRSHFASCSSASQHRAPRR